MELKLLDGFKGYLKIFLKIFFGAILGKDKLEEQVYSLGDSAGDFQP